MNNADDMLNDAIALVKLADKHTYILSDTDDNERLVNCEYKTVMAAAKVAALYLEIAKFLDDKRR